MHVRSNLGSRHLKREIQVHMRLLGSVSPAQQSPGRNRPPDRSPGWFKVVDFRKSEKSWSVHLFPLERLFFRHLLSALWWRQKVTFSYILKILIKTTSI